MEATKNIKTYRHEFGKEFMAKLSGFSKVHQYDDRHTYKSEWNKWTQQEEIAEAIDAEKRRLQENGYTGDIDDKMFKAGRYYFRKKTLATAATAITTTQVVSPPDNNNNDNDNKDNDNKDNDNNDDITSSSKTQKQQGGRQRRPYITMSKETIRMMDDHIASMHNTEPTKFKPSSCYDEFYQTKMSSREMTNEIEKIIEKYQKAAGTSNISPDEVTNEIIDKIKKTYKNRYYKFVVSVTVTEHN